MASKREEQMAARYAEMSERNKQLEQQNAALHAEIEALRAKADEKPNEQPEPQNAEDTTKAETLRTKAADDSSAGITKDELKQMLGEILLSQNETLEVTNRLVKATDTNVRNIYELFLILANDGLFQDFCNSVYEFRSSTTKYIERLNNNTKKLSEATTVTINPAIKDNLGTIFNEAVKDMAERLKAALYDATENVLEKVRNDKAIVLSGAFGTILLIALVSSLCFLGLTLILNHGKLHCTELFYLQYGCVAAILLPIFIVFTMYIWKLRRKDFVKPS